MTIHVTSVYVDDQAKALRFHTEILDFVAKTDTRSATRVGRPVVSPEDPDGTELVRPVAGRHRRCDDRGARRHVRQPHRDRPAARAGARVILALR